MNESFTAPQNEQYGVYVLSRAVRRVLGRPHTKLSILKVAWMWRFYTLLSIPKSKPRGDLGLLRSWSSGGRLRDPRDPPGM